MMRNIAALAFLIAGTAQADSVKLAVTTSFENSGLSEVLLPAIKADTDIDVQLLVVGTGQALRLGAAGDVDAVLVHARAAEEAFVADGHGTHRREIMYNDFVIVGPDDDPAMAAQSDTVVAVMQALANAEVPFVSRGDDSGTHKAEMSLWAAAELEVGAFGQWYKSVGAGMGATLNTASGLNAYALTDRATWLNFGNKGDLALLFAGDPMLFNQYAFLPVNPDRHPHVAHDAVVELEAWLTSPAAQTLIDGYRIADEQVFTFNASAE